MKYALIFGGQSHEHEISIVSAISVKKVINNSVSFIFCDAHRNFYLIPENKMKAKFFSSKEYLGEKKLFLDKGGFYLNSLLSKKKLDCDLLINIIHGADGEDGKMAALFDFFDIPYIGPRLEGSVLSFNKLYTKHLAKEAGVKTLDYEVLNKTNKEVTIPYPVIVKPLRLGSSIGVSIVKEQKDLQYALDVAFEFDTEVLVEPFINGVKEYNLAGCKANEWIFSIIEEPQKKEFLDFDKKYKDFSRTARCFEADIDENLKAKIRQSFVNIYDPLFLGSLIRCDFFVIEGEVYLNEVNPNPGSMANYLFDDFNLVLEKLSKNLPKPKDIKVEYKYIHEINSAKGKA